MRKTRQRAIRAAFVRAHGRPPERTRWRGDYGAWNASEWRRAKKAHRRGRRSLLEQAGTWRVVTRARWDEVRRMQKRAARKKRRAA